MLTNPVLLKFNRKISNQSKASRTEVGNTGFSPHSDLIQSILIGSLAKVGPNTIFLNDK